MQISWIIAIIVCFASILLLKPIATSCGLVDTPDNRKRHVGNIPLIGGLSIYIATMISVGLYAESNQHLNIILVSISLIVFIGGLDDRYELNAKLRLVAQGLIASVLTFGTNIQINSLGNLFNLGEVLTGPLSELITIIAIVAGINAFNMTDGIDGLAGSLGLLSLLSIGFITISTDIKLLVGIFVSALMVFLMFNLGVLTQKNKIFMGDAGSMMLGLVVSWLLIVCSQSEQASIAPAHVLWFIAVPLIDMVAVMYRRIRRGKSPLVADREHLHHVFMDVGLKPRQALLFISIISFLFCVVGHLVVLYKVPEYITLFSFCVIFIIYNKLLSLRHKCRPNNNI